MTRDVETASSAHSSQQGRTTEWITMGSEVRGVSVDAGTAALLHEHDTQRPCATLLDRYVACVQEYNIELCDDEKFLYRKCIREFVQQQRDTRSSPSR
mmetsp:Transcript_23088/g.59318  ORF Transcript_23088/g.59318 Transcript_23088/m.59318 type:complete len:98 (-) Transcript_23088:164-457(-)